MENILPEDVGLARCTKAFLNISNSQFSDAVAILEEVSFVDRLVEYLSYVLKFHALTVNNLNAPSDQQRRIYVLAKAVIKACDVQSMLFVKELFTRQRNSKRIFY